MTIPFRKTLKQQRQELLVAFSVVIMVLVMTIPFSTASLFIKNTNHLLPQESECGEVIPVNHYSEQEGNTWRIFGYPKYYKNDQGEYEPVDTTIRPSDRPGYAWEVIAGVYSLWIKENGAFTFKHFEDERSLEIDGIVVQNDSSGWEELAFDFNLENLTPIINEDTIKWTHPNGISYEINYRNDQLVDKVYIPERLKSAVFSSLPDDEIRNTAVGIRYSYSVEKDSAVLDTSNGDIVFRSPETGKRIHWITPAPLRFGEESLMDSLDLRQAVFANTAIADSIEFSPSSSNPTNTQVIRDKELTETKFYDMVPASAFTLGKTGLLFNDTVTFGDRGGANYTGVQDGSLDSDLYSENNFGITDQLIAGCFNWFGAKILYRPVFQFDLSAFDEAYPEARITSADLSLWSAWRWGTVTHTMSIYALLDDWGNSSGDWDVHEGTKNNTTAASGEVCWDYQHFNTEAWTDGGADRNTSGVDGDVAGDYDGTDDRGNTALTSLTGTFPIGAFYSFTFSSQLALDTLQYQKEHAGHRYGFIMVSNQDALANRTIHFSSSEESAAYRPLLTINFTSDSQVLNTTTGSFTPANVSPTVDSVQLWSTVGTPAETTTMTPLEEYNIKVDVTDNNTLNDLTTVKTTVYYDADGTYDAGDRPGSGNTQTGAILTWTNGGSPAWTIDPSASTTWVVNSGSSSAPTLTDSTGTFEFYFTPSKVASESLEPDEWHIYAVANDGTTGDGYQEDREMNWYGEISVSGTTSFGTVSLGTSGSPSGAVSTTYISNGAYDEQVKSDTGWVGLTSSGTISLYTSGTNPGSAQFALKADDDATLADAVQVTSASYATIDDSGTQTAESGDTQANNHLWLWLGSADIPDEEYQGSVYLKINDGS